MALWLNEMTERIKLSVSLRHRIFPGQ